MRNLRTTVSEKGAALFILGALLPIAQAVRSVADFPLLGTGPIILIVFYSLISRTRLTFPTDAKYYSLFIVFIGLMVFGVTHSRAPMYGLSKILFFSIYYVVLGYALLSLITSVDRATSFLSGMMFGSIVALCLYLLLLGSPADLLQNWGRFERLRLGSGNPIIFSQNLGIGLILFFGFATRYISNSPFKFILAGLIILSFLFMILSGSKGPILATAASLLYLIGLPSWRLLFSAIILFAAIITIFPTDLFSPAQDFISQRYVLEDSGSVSSRKGFYIQAFEGFEKDSFFAPMMGHGTGDFGFVMHGYDARGYPHNVLIETLYEFGLAGFFIYIAILFCPIYVAKKVRKPIKIDAKFRNVDHGKRLITSLYLFAVLAAQFTGDIGSNWYIPLFAMLLIAFSNAIKNAR